MTTSDNAETEKTSDKSNQGSVLANVWLLGSLVFVTRRTFSSALYEFAYLILWSTLPFWLGALIGYVTSDAPDKSMLAIGIGTFRNGELLVFTISTLAPTLYLILHDPEGARIFPHKLPLSTIVVFTTIVCSALFAIMKSSTTKDTDFVFSLSVGLGLLAAGLRFLSIIYHRLRLPETSEKTLRANENDFVSAFKARVGDQND